MCVFCLHRTPSKQKSPKKEGEVDIVELLRGHDPKDYEKVLRDHEIYDYRAILEAISFLKKEKEDETGKVVRNKLRSQVCLTSGDGVMTIFSDKNCQKKDTSDSKMNISVL